ncbi:MAG: helix-turn-helix transcriptional regulator [Anaerolineae bacterium]|nr:helix-turn-helix transcriptional regulator [Anaerolineae bacterium]
MSDDRSFGDFSARMRKLKKPEPEPTAVQPDYDMVYTLRQRILGVLIRDARQVNGKSVTECAEALGVSPELFVKWEYGEDSPSLPQIEMLAYLLDVPVSHFWGVETLEAAQKARQVPQDDFIALRNRIIGALIRRARKEAQLSPEVLANRIGVDEEMLLQYEFGQIEIALPVLLSIASATNVPINFFLEATSRVGSTLELGEDFRRFKQMRPEVRHFVVQPMNQSYLELAMRLSEMSVEELRGIAEGILNITY